MAGGIEETKKRLANQLAAFEKIWKEEKGDQLILGAEPHDAAAVWFSEGVVWHSEQNAKGIKQLKNKCEDYRTGLRNLAQFVNNGIHIDAHRIAASVPCSIIKEVQYVCAGCNGYTFIKRGYDHKAKCPTCDESDKVAVRSIIFKDINE